MNVSITTDFLADTGCPESDLRRIAEAGFSHIHWCHHWSTDFVYHDAELAAIERWLREMGLALQDLHASHGKDNFSALRELFAAYPRDYVGLCYDSGHGNQAPNDATAVGLDELDGMKDRLIALHLHDNDGHADQHRLPFTGTLDWPRLCRIISESSYTGCVSMESLVHQEQTKDPEEFLRRALAAGERLTRMIAEG